MIKSLVASFSLLFILLSFVAACDEGGYTTNTYIHQTSQEPPSLEGLLERFEALEDRVAFLEEENFDLRRQVSDLTNRGTPSALTAEEVSWVKNTSPHITAHEDLYGSWVEISSTQGLRAITLTADEQLWGGGLYVDNYATFGGSIHVTDDIYVGCEGGSGWCNGTLTATEQAWVRRAQDAIGIHYHEVIDGWVVNLFGDLYVRDNLFTDGSINAGEVASQYFWKRNPSTGNTRGLSELFVLNRDLMGWILGEQGFTNFDPHTVFDAMADWVYDTHHLTP